MNLVRLKDLRTGSPVSAEVNAEVSMQVLQQTQREWNRSKQLFLGRLRQDGHPEPKDYRWDWPEKFNASKPGQYEFYSVACRTRIEGLMMLSLLPIASRRAKSVPDEVLYIEYIEAAPWNLEEYAGIHQLYKGIGSALVASAIRKSAELGCGGRVGLHSLVEAEGFYRRAGFTDFGMDLKEKLRYFELETPASA